MIKEIFEIEPKQKNVLITLCAISFLSFLQLYIFKKEILEKSSLEIIGVSLGLTICWTIINFPPLLMFFHYQVPESKEKDVNTEKVIFSMGILMICWIALLTYIAYELNLCFKNFIRLAIAISIIRSFFWLIFTAIKGSRT